MTRVRRASVSDVPVMLRLVAAYWDFESIKGFDAARVGQALERLLSEPRLGAAWIALTDDTPVGYLLAVYVFSLEHLGLTAEIDEFFVSPAGRGTGVGSALLEAAEHEFTRVGCTNVSLQLARENNAARRFYHRQGYVERQGFELLEKTLPAPGLTDSLNR